MRRGLTTRRGFCFTGTGPRSRKPEHWISQTSTRYVRDHQCRIGSQSVTSLGCPTRFSLTVTAQTAQRSFPLCMRSMHETLRAKHHLFHDARMQYGLFLKGTSKTALPSSCSSTDTLASCTPKVLGLRLRTRSSSGRWSSLACRASLPRSSTRSMPTTSGTDQAFFAVAWFQLVWADRVRVCALRPTRHNYGLEGRKADYTPYSCVKIIESQPAADKVLAASASCR
jgi:hypothetical protein